MDTDYLQKIGCFILNHWEFIFWLIGTLFAFYQSFKVEKLKNKLEIEKNKVLLNDSKIRQAYESFISTFFTIIKMKENSIEIDADKINNTIDEFVKNMLLFSWPNTIKSIWKYKASFNLANRKKVLLMEKIILAMRKDLWVSNSRIKEFEIFQIFINSDIKTVF